jgi:hypothetical protein
MVSRVEAENTTALAFTHEDAEGFVQKIALLEGELALECRAQEAFEGECQEQFEELTILQTRCSELCHAIVNSPWARHHLFERMRLVALRHTEMAEELAALRVVVFSIAESVLGCSPNDTVHVEVMGELVVEF